MHVNHLVPYRAGVEGTYRQNLAAQRRTIPSHDDRAFK
jgi:hypothetical protein